MMRITVDKIASATKNVPLRKDIRVSPTIIAKEGYLVAGRIHGEKTSYNTLENCEGRMVALNDGDVVVGVLGHRNALQGYSGIVPESVSVGDRLNILNLGGVIGKCTSVNPDVGHPYEFEVLGAVLVFPEFENRRGIAAHVSMNALQFDPSLSDCKPPVIFIAGTCMNSGKTFAATQIVRELHNHGLTIAAAKLTGVSLLRDTLAMEDNGANMSASFVDAGIVTTSPESALRSAQTVLGYLSSQNPDVIVAELGDGILGMYGVQNILADQSIRDQIGAFIVCANDPVGAWGSVELLKREYGIKIDIISGPTTDNEAGSSYIRSILKVNALNARTQGKALAEEVLKIIQASPLYRTTAPCSTLTGTGS